MSEDVKPYGAPRAPEEPTPDELRALIAMTGMSQRRAAEALGMGERQMRYYASGRAPIPIMVIYALRYLAGQTATLPTDRQVRELLADLRKQVEADRAAGRDPVFRATRGELHRLLNEAGGSSSVRIDREGRVHLDGWGVEVEVVSPPAT